ATTASDPSAETAVGYNPFSEIVRLQKQLQYDLNSVADGVQRVSAQVSTQAGADLGEAVRRGVADMSAALIQLDEAVSRLTERSAATGRALSDVLLALSSQTKA